MIFSALFCVFLQYYICNTSNNKYVCKSNQNLYSLQSTIISTIYAVFKIGDITRAVI